MSDTLPTNDAIQLLREQLEALRQAKPAQMRQQLMAIGDLLRQSGALAKAYASKHFAVWEGPISLPC